MVVLVDAAPIEVDTEIGKAGSERVARTIDDAQLPRNVQRLLKLMRIIESFETSGVSGIRPASRRPVNIFQERNVFTDITDQIFERNQIQSKPRQQSRLSAFLNELELLL